MENFYKTYRHFTVSIQKLIKKKTGEKYSSLKELNDIFKYDYYCDKKNRTAPYAGSRKINCRYFIK